MSRLRCRNCVRASVVFADCWCYLQWAEDARTWSRVSVLGKVLEGVKKEEGGRVDVLAVTSRVGASAAVDQARQVM